MAKTARRSVASDPSSPFEYLRSASAEALSSLSSSSSSSSSTSSASSSSHIPVDPLRPTGSLYTTKTIPKLNATDSTSRPFSSNRFPNANASSPTPPPAQNFNSTDRDAAERARVRMEFYATYDVMTGVRIAATLGGFFGLMVFLVVYKSRGESQETIKALKDPKIAAVAAAVMQEEEDRELQQAMEATGMSIYPDEYDHIGYRRERLMSVGNVSAPPIFNRGYRFSSLGGGYSSLLGPPIRRFSYSESGRKSTSETRVLSAYPMGGSFGIDDYFLETDGDEADDEFDQITTASAEADRHNTYLSVPTKGQESRRSSNITCCSTDSSYLERRCSAVTLGLTPMPPISSRNPSRRQSATDNWDYYYPGIQVIQPTPKTSPCPSEKSINEKQKIGRHKSLIEQESFDCISVYSSDDKISADRGAVPKTKSATTTAPATSATISHFDTTTNRSKFLDSYAASSSLILDNSLSSFSGSQNHQHQQHPHHIIRRAPLASLSSFKISSIDYQDSDLKSLGSDSVFAESYADTDDEMEQFSTDSDEISDAQSPPNTRTVSSAHQQYSYHPHLISGRGSSSSSKIGSAAVSSLNSSPGVVVSVCSTVNEMRLGRTGGGGANSSGIDNMNRNCGGSYSSNNNSNNNVMPKSSSVHLVNTFETKAIIERYHQPLPIVTTTTTTTTTSAAAAAATSIFSSNATLVTANNISKVPLASVVKSQTQQQQQQQQQQRPASYSGCTSSSLSNYNKNSNQNNKINNKSSECVDINVVVVDNRSIVSPSVILELPVISTQEIIGDPPIDPSLPGTSRKWSKETLF